MTRLGFFITSTGSSVPCPDCGGELKYRDKRKRFVKRNGGEKEILYLNRLKCSGCGRLHTELPDLIIPNKHYAADVIQTALETSEGIQEGLDEDRPSDYTRIRWCEWYARNILNICGHVKRALEKAFGFDRTLLESGMSLLDELRRRFADRWLSVEMKLIYNSGASLEA